ncbi:hypothetical protein Lalb_Chr07g0189891 [Lupinus albus]|uniref:Uncharacterized protein n=1 Tax=Lupinus albus TaxID=3870 RepID=A0A6A4QB70_LUPAL|nr:hypothetical protein Lalb_Chr07g0189891 [Lupinus albus]
MNVFAWSYKDMRGLNHNIASHKIPLYSGVEPKKPKLRRMRLDMLLKAKEVATTQLESSFI